MDVYTTDADIAYYGLVLLRDDRDYFPAYEAVIVYRADLAQRAPHVIANFRRLEGVIDAAQMRAMNAAVKIKKKLESKVALDFLQMSLGISAQAHSGIQNDNLWTRLARTTLDHLFLVIIFWLFFGYCFLVIGYSAFQASGGG